MRMHNCSNKVAIQNIYRRGIVHMQTNGIRLVTDFHPPVDSCSLNQVDAAVQIDVSDPSKIILSHWKHSNCMSFSNARRQQVFV